MFLLVSLLVMAHLAIAPREKPLIKIIFEL
jgi:hypothetical protein